VPRPDRHHKSSDADQEIPPRLAADLRRVYRQDSDVPDSARDALMHDARTDLGNLKRSRRWGGLGLIAAAAMIVFAFQLVLRQISTTVRPHPAAPPTIVAVAPREDIDGNGRVDILDAFSLARQLSRRGALDPKWDFNADGTIDQRDVDAVARAAVRLKGEV